MFKVGDVCLKIAGRDAGLIGIVIKIEPNGYLLLDGQVRRRAVNPIHVEPLGKNLKIKENASHEEVVEALKSIGVDVGPKGKSREHPPRPKKIRRSTEVEKEGIQDSKVRREEDKEKIRNKKEEKKLEEQKVKSKKKTKTEE